MATEHALQASTISGVAEHQGGCMQNTGPLGHTHLMVPQLLVVLCVAWCARHLANPKSATLAHMPVGDLLLLLTRTLREFCSTSRSSSKQWTAAAAGSDGAFQFTGCLNTVPQPEKEATKQC